MMLGERAVRLTAIAHSISTVRQAAADVQRYCSCTARAASRGIRPQKAQSRIAGMVLGRRA